MPHTYAFLWVLLLLRGNDIRFYRGKIQKFFYSPKEIRISFIFQTKRKFKKDTLLGDTLVFEPKKESVDQKRCNYVYIYILQVTTNPIY